MVRSFLSVGLMVALALGMLVIGEGVAAKAPAADQVTQAGKVTGKVTAYEDGKSITLDVNGKAVSFVITKFTKIAGKVAVGESVTVGPGDDKRNARTITAEKKA